MTNRFEEDTLREILRIAEEKRPQTVAELVSISREKLSTSDEKTLQAILELQKTGRIRLAKNDPPASATPTLYLKTLQPLWYWLTIATAIATAVAVFTIPGELYPFVYARYTLGAIYVLWLPGYALIKALFPENKTIVEKQNSLDTIERSALSIGLSLALVPIVGLLLNYTPWGIRPAPITLSLLALTLILATVALVREHNLQISQAACPSPNSERLPETQQSAEVNPT